MLVDHTSEIAAMKQRRADILAERDQLYTQPEGEARDSRIWAIENELDGMDARLQQLGLPLDTLA